MRKKRSSDGEVGRHGRGDFGVSVGEKSEGGEILYQFLDFGMFSVNFELIYILKNYEDLKKHQGLK